MPFDHVIIVLGASFAAAWAFIAGMLASDSLDNARRLRFDESQEEWS